MKKLTIIPIVTALVLLLSAAAYATSISYEPPFIAQEAVAGESVHIPMGIMVHGLENPAIVRFMDSVNNGNLPVSWLTVGPDAMPVMPEMPFAEAMLMVSIPDNTPPGTYNGFITSSLEDVEGGADPGRGTYVQITVLPAASCAEAPSLEITGIDPKNISVPNNKNVDITVSGTVANADGCNDLSVSFDLVDEYGEIEAGGPLTLDGNAFVATVTVSASRKGSDKDGRTYQVNISAENETGSAGASVNVTVGHDSGKKK